MKKYILIIGCLFLYFFNSSAQNFLTRNGKISFYSKTKLEDIRATNNEAVSSLNTQTGVLQFLVLIKGFQFKNASMQQHFNDKEYMHSDKFPKSEFKGTITNLSDVNFQKEGVYPVNVSGQMTMRGVTKPLQTNGTITIKGGKISSAAVFKVKLKDYKIKVPSIVTAKIAETIEITIDCKYEAFNR